MSYQSVEASWGFCNPFQSFVAHAIRDSLGRSRSFLRGCLRCGRKHICPRCAFRTDGSLHRTCSDSWLSKAGENSTIWNSPSPKFIMGGSDEEKYDHPTQKPVELMRRPILNHLRRGELVYDPFLGSGTTLAAAELTERVCYGVRSQVHRRGRRALAEPHGQAGNLGWAPRRDL